MKLDFTQKLLDFRGRPIELAEGKDGEGKDKLRDGTLSDFAVDALLCAYQDENGVDGTEKFRRYKIAVKIDNNAEAALEVEEIAKIKQLLAKRWGPLVVGRAFEMLEAAKGDKE